MQSEIYKDLQEHCYDLSLVIGQFDCNNSADWLMIASGIQEINFVWNRYDKYFSWFCKPAIQYDDSKTNITSNYIFYLTVFNYIWGAFESLVSEKFTKKQIKKYGKINCVANILNKKESPIFKHQYFRDDFYRLLKIIINDGYFHIKENYTGEIDIIYNIRNHFAHGSLKFPEDENYTYFNPINMLSFLEVCSRIVLFHIQSLLVFIKTSETGLCLPNSFFENTYEVDDFDIITSNNYILSRLHLRNIPEADKLFTLFGKRYFELKSSDIF